MSAVSTPVALFTQPTPDFAAIKARQQSTWAAGDYAMVATTVNLVSELLCETANISGGERVLDVACGSGNCTLAAARRFADVTGIDYVPSLIDQAREIARATRMPGAFIDGDAEALPFGDGTFDVVTSVFGVMFTANQDQAAAELRRVCRPGGRIALACWTPDGFIGEMFRTISSHVPPPPLGVRSALLWGTTDRLSELFPRAQIQATARIHTFRYRSPRHWYGQFSTCYGPTVKALESLEGERRKALEADLLETFDRFAIRGHNGAGVAVRAQYLEAVITM
ncbi:MAG: class I SAM-dependent methyltransferase [Phycisphaerales bacterium]